MAQVMKDLGTVLDYTGKKGRLVFRDRNLANTTKRIVVRLFNKKDEEWRVICSEGVSALLRSGELAVGMLPSLSLMRDADDKDAPVFICLPQGNDVEHKIEDLTLRDFETQEVSKEDYLVL